MADIERLDFSKPPPGYEPEGWGARSPANKARVWAHFKDNSNPPGMTLLGAFWCSLRTNPKAAEARSAAWAWYEKRLALADRAEDDPRYRIDFCGSCGWENPPQAEDRCLECGSTDCLVTTWGDGQAKRYRSGERYTTLEGEQDQDEGPDLWPRCLTWSDEEVAEVERWLADGAAETPSVLRG